MRTSVGSAVMTRLTFFAFGLTAGSIIAAQIVVSRMLASTIGYYYGFMIVSLAMLGLGSGGLLVQQLPKVFTPARMSTQAAASVALMAVLGFVGVLLVLLVYPYTSSELRGVALAIMFVCFFPYFFAGGTAVSLVLLHAREQFFKAYAVDLGSAALGAVLSVGLLEGSSPTEAFLGPLCIIPMVAAAAYLVPRKRYALSVLALVGVGVLFLAGGRVLQHDRLRDPQHMGWLHVRPVATGWNSFSNVSVYPGRFFTWALSPKYKGPQYPMVDLLIDGIGGTEIVKFDGREDSLAKLDYLRYDITALAHELVAPDRDQLIIGPGGGVDILQAKHFGRKELTVVEINPLVVSMVNDQLADWSGSPYRLPGVDVVVDNGRTFIKRTDDTWDLITLTWVDSGGTRTAMALNENYLYTIESYREFLSHLNEGGYMAFMRSLGLYEPLRVDSMRGVSIAVEALEELGVEDSKRHIMVAVADSPYYAGRPMCYVLVKRSPVTAAESEKAREFFSRLDFIPVWLPDGSVARDAVPAPYVAHTQIIWDIINTDDREQLYEQSAFDIEPPTDDRPFYFAQRGGPNREAGAAIDELVSSTLILAGLVVPFLLVPLIAAMRKKQALGSLGAASVGYFSMLGFAFMLVEIEMFHLFSMILGNPTYSLSVVLASLLVFSGCGSLLSKRLVDRGPRAVGAVFVALIVLLAGFSVAKGGIAGLLIPHSLGVRILGTVAILAPLGVLMGTPMSMGMTLIARRPELMMWGWAVNGVLSVFASVVAMYIAMHVGIAAVFFLGVAAYAIAAGLFQVMARTRA
ncbi:MAG: hypothetical protein KJO07_07950 [Deltaproteobacteria bacterium]|nr:hypothetical protein [Deltaproteobacteria bacterium]